MEEPSHPYVEGLLEAFTLSPRDPDACPFCGWTSGRYRETGLLGCPLCYSVPGFGFAANEPK